MMKEVLKIILVSISIIFLTIVLLLYSNVLWQLAPYYKVKQNVPIEEPIMDMNAYEEIWDTHRRPYIFSVRSKFGSDVIILGISHTKDVNDPQLDSIKYYWDKSNPDIALVEGRVGNLFTWIQDPVKELGEGGFVTSLAHKKGVKIYSWEPDRETEIEILLKDFSKEEIAMFYTFRPYFSNMIYGKPSNPEAQLQNYLDSRTDYPQLKGVFTSWEELDNKWKKDFPDIDWRNHDDGNGYPDGYLHSIWNRSNVLRDEHMLQIIFDLVSKGNTVFVTMGASHAPRIEKSLEKMIK
jgi:hypothetical protein